MSEGGRPGPMGAGWLSPRARERLDRAARAGPEPLRPPPIGDLAAVARWRAAVHEAWLDGDPPAEACGHREDRVAGVRVLRSVPPAGDGSPLVVYLHGGGYTLGSPEVALPITERLARGCEVVSVDYRLAPEHPCPAGVGDAEAVTRALLAVDHDRPLVLAGDSAGANLALSAALSVGSHPAPAALVLFSPHTDATPSAEHETSGRPSDLDRAGARWLAEAYQGDLAPDDPRLSPALGDLSGLPPILIQVGTIDTCFEQGIRLARRARSAGVEVDLDVWEGLWHTWHYHRDLPEADRALAEAVTFARRAAGLPPPPT